MNASTRIAAYAAGLAVVLGGGYLIGDLADIGRVGESPHSRIDEHEEHAEMGTMTAMKDSAVPGGLQASEAGYTLAMGGTAQPGERAISFRIIGPDGAPVTAYETSHEKQLHLIAVRRDFGGFQHAHPVLDRGTGAWSVPLRLTPGTWRVFADFVPAGASGMTLGHDVLVAGEAAATLPGPSRVATVDGYRVVAKGDLTTGDHSMLDFEVTRDGKPVTDLQPYLGAYGHLVALREGDLAYLHVHPDGEPGDGRTEPGPEVSFGTEVPSAGRYHLFLDFKHDGKVRTAAFTLDAASTTTGDGSL